MLDCEKLKTLKSGKPDTRGGARRGAGKPKGVVWPSTLEKVAARTALQTLAQAHAAEALNVLVRVMRHGKGDAARLAGAREVLDRALGKPAQALTDPDGGKLPVPTTVVHVHQS